MRRALTSAASAEWAQFPQADWGERAGHAVVALSNDSLLLLGGSVSSSGDDNDDTERDAADVWRASAAAPANWTRVTAAADWAARSRHAVVELNDTLFLLGGFSDADMVDEDDVWLSSDGGASWSAAAASAPWLPRDSHTAVALNDTIFVMGGYGVAFFRDTWASRDGVAWAEVPPATATWSARHSHASVVHDGHMYVLGGVDEFGFTNDVWRSAEGASWETVTPAAEWSRRNGLAAASHGDRIYIFGGNNAGVFSSDLWWSEDGGASWTEAFAPSEMRSRASHAMLSWQGELWVVGGRVACGDEDERDQAGASAENRCYIGDAWRGNGLGLADSSAGDDDAAWLDLGLTLALAGVLLLAGVLAALVCWRRRQRRQGDLLRPKQFKAMEMTDMPESSSLTAEQLAQYVSERAAAGAEAGEAARLSARRHLLDPAEIHVGAVVGRGSFGVVRRGMWRGMDIAIKTVHDAPLDTVVMECEIMASVGSHRNVVQFLGLTCDATLGLSLVTEFMANGSLDSLMYKTSERNKRGELAWFMIVRMAADAAAGVAHLHHEGVIHRDLACRNLLVDEHNTVAVADFGFARVKSVARDSGFTTTRLGPIKWEAPECWVESAGGGGGGGGAKLKEYSEASDVWSFGVCLYEMATGLPPWYGFNDLEAANAVVRGETMAIPPECDEVFAGVMRDCWQRDPAMRPTMAEVHKRLHLYYSALAPVTEVKRPRKERSFRQQEGSGGYVAFGDGEDEVQLV